MIWLISVAILIFIVALIDNDLEKATSVKAIVLPILLAALIIVSYSLGFRTGELDGAKNQMRGKYKVEYKVDENMNVLDTIIWKN
jgi:uncharacterized membrane protein YkvI